MGRERGGARPKGPPHVSPKQSPAVQEISGRDLFTVTEVLSSKEASCIVEYAESLGLTHQSSRGPKFGEAFRDNDRVSIQDQAWADTLWTALGLQGTLGRDPTTGAQPVGLNPNLRFYRYRPGQRFGRHIDESNDLGGGKFTLYTVLIYLSTPGEGGETVFYKRGKRLAAVSPRTGLALLHRHGRDCLLHEGAEVAAGEKWVLRSDVVYA
ncbi:hypothetical protein ACKKBG_A23525 [Auxenochlorella protothecoides x Auxenochlorella symbiontica]